MVLNGSLVGLVDGRQNLFTRQAAAKEKMNGCIIHYPNNMREQETTKAIFDKAFQQAQKLTVSHITGVQLAMGEIAELDQEHIRTYWAELSKGTLLEHVPIYFRSINAHVQCMACFKKYHPVNGNIHCPHCGSFGAKILSGEEFYFEFIKTNNE